MTNLRDAMNTYGNTVYRLALCRMQSVPDAEDVYQDVFLRLLQQDTADWDAGHTKAWLIRTTVIHLHYAEGYSTGEIAAVGSTGKSTGLHLCFQVWQEGETRSPVAFFDVETREQLSMG